jgi:hypothetical protein
MTNRHETGEILLLEQLLDRDQIPTAAHYRKNGETLLNDNEDFE